MMKRHNFVRRILALLLVLVMTLGYLPAMSMPAVAAEETAGLTVSGKIADPETLHNWQAYYGDSSVLPDGSTGTSTWKAGGVWTDKSVFASDSDITAAGLPTSLKDQDAFLVSLSALASNKEVVGQSSAPVDTVLVLDLSNSMDNSRSVDDMIEAANGTIDTLLKMNVNNRVGVVLYSGNTNSNYDAQKSSATVILPLDHYTTTTTTRVQEDGQWVIKYQYLTVTGTSDTTVSVAAGTRNSNNTKPNGSKNTNGGTYIQNGLFQAWEAFEDMTDKGVVQSGTQAGVQRTPILVLMSDGAPTIATTNYYNVGTSNTGDGTNTTDRITFLTQLTAAWVKGKVSAYYNNTTAKFYTLGLGTANDENATAVLYPSGSNNTIRNYWTNFNTGTTDGASVYIGGSNQNRWSVNYQSVAASVGRNYVDLYKSASNSSELLKAFKEIVDEIGLQSAYTATLVQSGNADLDGYITVEDELGSMMQVKDIKGILLGDTLFTGQELAKNLNEGSLGSTTNPTAYGEEFVATVKERLGVDTSVAQQLIGAAYGDNQLYYNAETGAYSNYIGWYGDTDNNYLGFWDKDTGLVAEGAPAGAKYINQSYGFMGGTAGTVGATDMMHIIVMVHTEITTGHQTVLFKVPAALIPMITYKVELEGDSLETATDLTLTVEENDPIRLLYEVGLPDDVNDFNLQQKVAEYLAKDGSNHIHQNADGSYTFYANSWGAVHDVAPDISELTDSEKQALTASVAESHFIPNTANERFYVLEDSLVYTRSGNSYSVLTSLPVAGGEYYFARTIVNMTGANGKAEAVTQYEILSAATVAQSSNFKIVNGNCYVKEGTVRQTLSNLELPKDPNKTDTIGYSNSLWVYVPGADAEDYNVYSFLGNNGKLTITPTTGIAVTKNITEVASGAAADEKFTIQAALDMAYNAENVAKLSVTDTDGNALSATGDYAIKDNAGKILVELYLADDQIVYITGIPADTAYTVVEAANKNYTASYTYENPDKMTQLGTIEGVIVTNDPVKPGNLYITKEVIHSVVGETFPADYEFEFEALFVDLEGKPLANTTFSIENNYDATLTSLTTDADGVMHGKLKHGETAWIKNIPAGTVVTVTEVNVPDLYTVAYRSRNASGLDADNDGTVTIVSESNATVVATNTYTPKSTTVDLDIAGTKIFEVNGNLDAQHAGSFTFIVEQRIGNDWVEITNKTATLNYAEGEGSSTKNFSIENVLEGITFSQAGTYTYQVREVIGSVANVTYDRTLYTFTVTVADVDGQLVATVTDVQNTEITDGSYEVSFTNEFHTAPVSIDIQKQVDDDSNNPLTSKAGFQFVAVRTDANWNVLTGEDAATLELYSDGAGEARMSATYKTEGSYYYVVTEADGGKPGWTYSEATYQIEVVVTKDDATGDLSANLIINGVDQQSDNAVITFENTYTPDAAEVDLGTLVNKNLSGRDLVAGEFTFAIFENGEASHTDTTGAVAVGTNDAQGNVVFTPDKLTFQEVGDYEYDIVEITGNLGGVSYDNTIYDLVIEVTDAGDGTLKANYYFEDSTELTVAFNNTYTAEPTEVIIEGMKFIKVNSGLHVLTAGQFTFGLYENGQKIGETTNLANGDFSFDKIVYDMDDAGKTFTYEIREIAPDGTTDGSYSANGMTYSGQTYTVTVKVTDNGQGQLVAEVTGNGANTIHFVNEYASNPASVSFVGTKTLTGRDLTADQFQFAIYASDATFTERTLVTDQITNEADGTVSFGFSELGMGYHYFVVKEVIPEERATGIHYDASEYHITIQVTDSGNGQMSALTTVYHSGDPHTVNPAIAFNNIYRPEDGQLVITGTKTLTGGKTLTDKEFSFELYEGSNKLATADVAADGTFAFEAITYTADDIGEHTYMVKETVPAGATENADGTWTLDNITYDATEYTVVVTVSDEDKDGVLEISKTVDGDAGGVIAFTNIHTPDPVEYQLQAHKTYEKGLTGNDFTFKLEGEIAGVQVEQIKYNDADGNVVFDPLSFPEAGTYTFTVKEIDKILGFISYSVAEYEVTVTVVNEDGVLRISSVTSVNTKGTNEADLEFVNTYVMEGEEQIVLNGTKTLIGDRTTVNAGEFTFGLYDASGTLIESVQNDANGNFSFSALIFDEDDVDVNGETQFVYTIKEIPGNNARYTYDDTVYTVEVLVQDNDEGGIDVSHTITANGQAADIAFTNTYTNPTPVTYTPAAKKIYNKLLSGGEFTFQLTGEIAGTAINQTQQNDADGNVAFETLSFPEAGTYTFTVKEINKILGFINYSAAEHTLTIEVIDTNGVLSISSVTINNDPDGTLEFTNVYNLDGEDQIVLSGTKTLTGDRTTVNAGEFTFGLYDANGTLIESVQNDADGNFTFAPLTFDETHTGIDQENTYIYTVQEIPGTNAGMTYDATVYTVEVLVQDNDEGGIDVSHAITANGEPAEIVFSNVYTITGTGVVQITGIKTYEGKQLQGEDFTFVLSQGEQELEQVTNAADGTFVFQPITYTAEDIGTHIYTVSEWRPADAAQNEDGSYVKDGVIYDANVYTVEVTVADDGNGGLIVTKKVNNEDVTEIQVTFDNAYQISGVGQLLLEGTKTLTGGKPLADGEFAFGLYEGDQLIAQAENLNGAFQLVKEYTAEELGDYTYTVAEILPEGATKNDDGTWTLGNITYDPTVYTVYVSVKDDQKGGIEVTYDLENVEAIFFENTYTPDNQVVTIAVQKILDNKTNKNVSLEGFEFIIVCGEESYTATSDAQGQLNFEVTFSDEHIGQTYEFKVSEKNTGIKGMTYDKTVYTIKVQVLQNADGTLKTVINGQTANKASVTFTNIYENLETPSTGDTFNLILPIVLMLLSILGVATVIITRKKKTA